MGDKTDFLRLVHQCVVHYYCYVTAEAVEIVYLSSSVLLNQMIVFSDDITSCVQDLAFVVTFSGKQRKHIYNHNGRQHVDLSMVLYLLFNITPKQASLFFMKLW